LTSVKFRRKKAKNDLVAAPTSLTGRNPAALSGMRRNNMVALDHPIQSLAVNFEDTRCRLFVSTSVFEHACNVATFDLRERDPVFNCRLIQRNLRLRRTLRRRKNVFRLQHRLLYFLNISSRQTNAWLRSTSSISKWDAAARRVGEDVRGCSAIVFPAKTFKQGRRPRPGRHPLSTREEFTPFYNAPAA